MVVKCAQETKSVGNGEVVGVGLRPSKVPGILNTTPPDLPLSTPPLGVCNYIFYSPLSPVARDADEDRDGDNCSSASCSNVYLFRNE